MKKEKQLFITIIITVISLILNPLIYNSSIIKNNIFLQKEASNNNVRTFTPELTLQNKNTPQIRIMTFNLLAHYKSWGGKNVTERKDALLALLNEYSPNILGVQEMCNDWYTVLNTEQTSLKFVTQFNTLKMTSLLYDSTILEVLESGDSAYSKLENPRSRRMVWAVFKDKRTSQIFTVINTHLSVLKSEKIEKKFFLQTCQVNELYTQIEKIYEEYPYPVIIIGDFNTSRKYGKQTPLNNGIYGILSSLYTDTESITENKIFGEKKNFKNTLNDHIFVKGDIKVKNLYLLSKGEYENLSDHFPLFCDIYF